MNVTLMIPKKIEFDNCCSRKEMNFKKKQLKLGPVLFDDSCLEWNLEKRRQKYTQIEDFWFNNAEKGG
jgi:hypothetical protein